MAALRDVVIVGGGHNGLVAAFYLARAGLKPLVLERRRVVGGAAITEEFHPGFRCSTLAHWAPALPRAIVSDMQLRRHGLEMLQADPRLFAPSLDGASLALFEDPAASAAAIARVSPADGSKFLEFHRTIVQIGTFIRSMFALTPPSLDRPSSSETWTMLAAGRRFRRLGRRDGYRLLRWVPMAAADLVGEWFENDLLRAVLAARGIFGLSLGPRSAGSGAALLFQAGHDFHSAGAAAVPRGGMGALTSAMAEAARSAGAEIRTDAPVAHITVAGGRASGAVLADGEEIHARTIVSNADPRRTLLDLVDPVHLDPDFAWKLRSYRSSGVSAKVNLALSRLPTFSAETSASDGHRMLAGRIHIGPGIDYLERAFDAAKYRKCSDHPYLDVCIPSLSDTTLAPRDAHVMSIYAQYAPYDLGDGDWDSHRSVLADTVIRTLSEYARDLPETIVGRQVLTPLDLERDYGLTGGHIHHGEMTLDQMFTMRPLLGWAQYRTPIQQLYLCGAGTRPGGGIGGWSGFNAAREVIKDRKKR